MVDDSPTIRDLIASMFKDLDYQVETAEMVLRVIRQFKELSLIL